MRADPPWCAECETAAACLRIGAACDRCALPAEQGEHACWPLEVPILTVIAGFRYTDPVARTIVTGKVRGAWATWWPLGLLLGRIVADSVERVDVVTGVPGDRRRVRWRGYDHAALLARGVATGLERPYRPLLETSGRHVDQASLGAVRRRTLPDDAFRATRPLEGARVLLVDDVLTTGSTVRVAAAALAAAGAAPVRVAVLARAGRHDLS